MTWKGILITRDGFNAIIGTTGATDPTINPDLNTTECYLNGKLLQARSLSALAVLAIEKSCINPQLLQAINNLLILLEQHEQECSHAESLGYSIPYAMGDKIEVPAHLLVALREALSING